jgi:hypothetical protein
VVPVAYGARKAQGLPWVFGLSPEALKGRPLTRHHATFSIEKLVRQVSPTRGKTTDSDPVKVLS